MARCEPRGLGVSDCGYDRAGCTHFLGPNLILETKICATLDVTHADLARYSASSCFEVSVSRKVFRFLRTPFLAYRHNLRDNSGASHNLQIRLEIGIRIAM